VIIYYLVFARSRRAFGFGSLEVWEISYRWMVGRVAGDRGLPLLHSTRILLSLQPSPTSYTSLEVSCHRLYWLALCTEYRRYFWYSNNR